MHALSLQLDLQLKHLLQGDMREAHKPVVFVCMQDERFSYVVLRRGGRKVGASQAISRHSSDAAEMHDPQPYLDAQPRSWKKSEARYQRALALENLMEGRFTKPRIIRAAMPQALRHTCS